MKLNEVYLSYIRSKPCVVCGKMGVDPHHLIARGIGGYKGGWKDFTTIPLCREHHTELEQIGVTRMEKKYEKYQLNLCMDAVLLLIAFFWDDEQMERSN